MEGRESTILTIDLGTSGPKVALTSSRGEILAADFEPVQLFLLPGGGAEQDPAEWCATIRAALRRLLSQASSLTDSIAALSCTAQWSGTVAVDQTGRPLMNALISMDTRGAPFVRQIVRGAVNLGGFGLGKLVTWIALNGGAPGRAGKDPIGHILYIQRTRPEVYRQTHKFLEPKDFLNLYFTGKFAASFDSISLHSLTDNRDAQRVAYDDRLLRFCGIAREKLPDLAPATDVLAVIRPELAHELGLRQDVQVILGTPDVHSAAIGCGGVEDFQAHLYLGTSSWISCHVPYKKTDIFHNLASFPSPLPGRYLLLDEQGSAGQALSYLRDQLFYPDDELSGPDAPEDAFQRFDSLAAAAPPGSDRVIFAPWLYGERTPVEDPLLRGGFFNLSLNTSRRHFVRAVYEGVALNSRWLFQSVEKFVGRRLDPLRIVGAGANSDLWCQIYADVLQRTVERVSQPVHVNARGAAFLAGLAFKWINIQDIPSLIHAERVFTPNPSNRQIYDELFDEFLQIYKQNQKMYTRLNKDR